MHRISYIAAFISCIIIILTGLLYYPKWQKPGTEATLSWDVSGYYMYLPAICIYKDLKACKFQDKLLSTYQPTYDFQQAFVHESGNHVMKYPMGMAVMYSPAFAVAHLYASYSNDYVADGFSRPYQFGIFIWNFLIAFIGIFTLRKVLIKYFDDKTVAIAIVLTAIGSNYLNYSAIDGAMTHNYLFTLYSLLLYYTIRWYSSNHIRDIIIIGALIGMMALIRPTEIIAAIIPLGWGLAIWKWDAIKERLILFWQKKLQLLAAAFVTMCIGMLQLSYWKYVAGEWLVYSYQDQGFSWLHPHIHDGLLSYKSGWLVYSPIMFLGVIGIYHLIKTRASIALSITAFLLVFTYIVTAWDIWWYGGSLGNRAMIQSYPLWAFGIAAFAEKSMQQHRIIKFLIGGIMVLFLYFNLWFTHQAHHGGLLHAGAMTKAYFWEVLGTYERDPLDVKLLDTDEAYRGNRKNVKILYTQDFENMTPSCIDAIKPLSGTRSLCINTSVAYSDPIILPLDKLQSQWLRVSADYMTPNMEWNVWKMAQCQVSLYENEELLSTKMIRIQRHLQANIPNRIWIDLDLTDLNPTQLKIQWWNAGSDKTLVIDNMIIEHYKSER